MQTGQPPSCSYPRWVLLEPYAISTNVVQDDSSCHVTPDAKTLAAATTSTGHRIHVSLVGLAEPPATSSLHVELLPVGDGGIRSYHARIVAAHGLHQDYERRVRTLDLFVYSAGAAADPTRRPPTLSLLPVAPADPM
nr:unnamed protein product [Digitaria exilis]